MANEYGVPQLGPRVPWPGWVQPAGTSARCQRGEAVPVTPRPALSQMDSTVPREASDSADTPTPGSSPSPSDFGWGQLSFLHVLGEVLSLHISLYPHFC